MIIFKTRLFNRVDAPLANKLQLHKYLKATDPKYAANPTKSKLDKLWKHMNREADYQQGLNNLRRSQLRSSGDLVKQVAKHNGREGVEGFYKSGVPKEIHKLSGDLKAKDLELANISGELDRYKSRASSAAKMSNKRGAQIKEMNKLNKELGGRVSELEAANKIHQNKYNSLNKELEGTKAAFGKERQKLIEKAERERINGENSVGVLRGLKNSWGRTSKLGKAGIIGAGAAALGGGVYLAGRHMGYWGKKKNRR